MKINWAERLRQQVHGLAESLGNLFVESFHYLALFAIGAVTAWAAVMEFLGMLENGHIKIDDILLLFIYLELGAMVGIYFKTNLPESNIFSYRQKKGETPMISGLWRA